MPEIHYNLEIVNAEPDEIHKLKVSEDSVLYRFKDEPWIEITGVTDDYYRELTTFMGLIDKMRTNTKFPIGCCLKLVNGEYTSLIIGISEEKC